MPGKAKWRNQAAILQRLISLSKHSITLSVTTNVPPSWAITRCSSLDVTPLLPVCVSSSPSPYNLRDIKGHAWSKGSHQPPAGSAPPEPVSPQGFLVLSPVSMWANAWRRHFASMGANRQKNLSAAHLSKFSDALPFHLSQMSISAAEVWMQKEFIQMNRESGGKTTMMIIGAVMLHCIRGKKKSSEELWL